MLGLLIYFLSVMDNLLTAIVIILGIVGTVLVVFGIVWIIAMQEADDDLKKFSIKYLRKTMVIFLILLLISVFVPNSKTIAAIYLLPKLANNEQVKQIPNKALKILNLKLDKYIDSYLEDKKE